jgi:hypothetical protein
VAVRQVKAIRLSSGMPGLKIEAPVLQQVSHPGIANAMGAVLAMAVRHPDKISLSNDSRSNSKAFGGEGGSVGDITNNNANSNTDVNPINNVINVGDGSANGTVTGTGDSTSTAGE